MKKLTLTFTFFLTINSIFGQNRIEGYMTFVATADSLYSAKNYKASAETYSKAFKLYPSKVKQNNLYDAACSWALNNNIDSAFNNLNRVIKEKNYYNVTHIESDADLTLLHNDKRWLPLINLVKENKIKMEIGFNMPIVKILDSVLIDDQEDRVKMDEIEGKYGYKSNEMDNLFKDMRFKDSIDLIKVETIVDKYGWLGTETIGDKGNQTLFLVIQHSNQKTQEKYLPLMRTAVKAGKARPAELALLEDRVALEEGKKQIYGSQVQRDPKTGKNSFFPIEDEPNVDKRREEAGLGPLRNYAKSFNFDYQLPRN